MPRGGANKKAVVQMDYYTGEKIEEYSSIAEASYDNMISTPYLSKMLNSGNAKLKTAKLWFKFK